MAPTATGIGVRTMSVDREQRGPIAVTVWYPSTAAGDAAITDAEIATGPWPIMLFSHGLRSTPGDYSALISGWVRAGFAVVAPTFPFTNRDAPSVDPGDVANQPADATAALDVVLTANATPGDPFNAHLDGATIVAAGHSEGAITTVGLFDECCRDSRLLAGIVLAGNSLGFPGAPAGTRAAMLFVHGDADRLVPYRSGKAAYGEVSWPKAFVTLENEAHVDPYLRPESAQFATVLATTIAFADFAIGRGDLQTLRESWSAPGVIIDDRFS